MSAEATFWAWNQDVKSTHKLVLLALGNCHNEATGQCNPSINYIVERTALNRKTVIAALKKLQELELITPIKKNGAGSHYRLSTKKQTSTKNGTGLDNEHAEESGAENGTGSDASYPQTDTKSGTGTESDTGTKSGTQTSTENGTTTGTENGTAPVPKTVPESKKNLKGNLKQESLKLEAINLADYEKGLVGGGGEDNPTEPVLRLQYSGQHYAIYQADIETLSTEFPDLDIFAAVADFAMFNKESPKLYSNTVEDAIGKWLKRRREIEAGSPGHPALAARGAR